MLWCIVWINMFDQVMHLAENPGVEHLTPLVIGLPGLVIGFPFLIIGIVLLVINRKRKNPNHDEWITVRNFMRYIYKSGRFC